MQTAQRKVWVYGGQRRRKKRRWPWACAALLLLLAAAMAGALLYRPAPRPVPGTPQRVYLLEDCFTQSLLADGADAAALAETELDKALAAGMDSVLWDITALPGRTVRRAAETANEKGLRLLLMMPSADEKARQKAMKRYGAAALYAPARPGDDGLGWHIPQSGGGPALLALSADSPQLYSALANARVEAAVEMDSAGGDMRGLLLPVPPMLPGESVSVPGTLGIGVPQDGEVIYAGQYYVMGTSDPALPVYVNGQQAARQPNGCWSVVLPFEPGKNVVTARQGGQEVSITVQRGGGSWSGGAAKADGSADLAPGQWLRVTSAIASLLEDAGSDDTILETINCGAAVRPEYSVRITRGSTRTHAYRVAGGWLLAKDVELLNEPLSGRIEAMSWRQEGGAAVLRLEGASPLALASRTDTSLTLHMPGAAAGCEMPAAPDWLTAELCGDEAGAALRFAFAPGGLWGWKIEYGESFAEITLKKPPERTGALPLAGVRVLLDAGHGEGDPGAVGPAGLAGPAEKDLNLALTLAVRRRLEMLGAEVLLTRADDTFYTLQQRNRMLRDTAPDLFVAVHHNSLLLDKDVSDVGGVECYYFNPSGQPLAQALAGEISGATGRSDRGGKYDYFYVTRSDICPAVLLEAGFVPNPAEFSACADGETLLHTAWAVGRAVQQVLGRE